MAFEVRYNQNRTVALVLVREFRVVHWPDFQQTVEELPDRGTSLVLVNLREMDYTGIDSVGIGALCGLIRRVRRNPGCRAWAFGIEGELHGLLSQMKLVDFMTSRSVEVEQRATA